MKTTAYYSEETKSWVRLEPQEDGDKSGNKKPLFGPSGLPNFLEHDSNSEGR